MTRWYPAGAGSPPRGRPYLPDAVIYLKSTRVFQDLLPQIVGASFFRPEWMSWNWRSPYKEPRI